MNGTSAVQASHNEKLSQLPTAGNKDLNDALHIPVSLGHCRQYLFTIFAQYGVKMRKKKFLYLKFLLSPQVLDLKQLSFFYLTWWQFLH